MRQALAGLALVAALAAVAGFASLSPAQDATVAARQEIKERIVRLSQRQEELAKTETRLNHELARYAELIGNSQKRTAELSQLAGHLPGILKGLRREADQQEPRLKQLQKRFAARLKALYLFGADGSLLLLASSQGLDDFLFRAQVLTRLLAADQARLSRLTAGRKRLSQLKEQLELHQKELARIEKDLADQRKGLADLVAERTALLEQVREEKGKQQMTLGALQDALARLARTFALSQTRSPGSSARPAGSPPVEGRVVRRGGPHKGGVLIKARPGAQVRSPWQGQVAHASVIPGYGQVVILDHGDRLHTVLGHLGAVSVTTGQKIAAGQVVGAVGRLGRLYLEVRRGAEAVNPARWLKLGT